jgi:hypothetical protein
MTFLDWKEQLRCSVCGSAKLQIVLSGHKPPGERRPE